MLAGCLSHLPSDSCVLDHFSRLEQRPLGPRAQVALQRCAQRHGLTRSLEGFRDTLELYAELLAKAARVGQWAVEEPEMYKQLLEEPQVVGFDREDTEMLLQRIEVKSDQQLEDVHYVVVVVWHKE